MLGAAALAAVALSARPSARVLSRQDPDPGEATGPGASDRGRRRGVV
jgi:hypothetical protein